MRFWNCAAAITTGGRWNGSDFETLCRDAIKNIFDVPGRRYGRTVFDCARGINWDMKASAIKTDRHTAILNDVAATDASIAEFGRHGVILALLDVEYNDKNRSFQKWHSELKGGLSEYERDRIARNATSRYRKTHAVLHQILLLTISADNIFSVRIGRDTTPMDAPESRNIVLT